MSLKGYCVSEASVRHAEGQLTQKHLYCFKLYLTSWVQWVHVCVSILKRVCVSLCEEVCYCLWAILKGSEFVCVFKSLKPIWPLFFWGGEGCTVVHYQLVYLFPCMCPSIGIYCMYMLYFACNCCELMFFFFLLCCNNCMLEYISNISVLAVFIHYFSLVMTVIVFMCASKPFPHCNTASYELRVAHL